MTTPARSGNRSGYPDEAILAVWVQPNASRDRIAGMMDGAMKVAVTAPPEKGKANKALGKLLAAELGLPKHAVAVVKGGGSRRKTLRLRGIRQEQLDKWLARVRKS